jgi:Zn-finger nucleic acid-binding protein
LICPKCKTSLSPTRVAGGSIWKCEVCSGVAANMAVLRKYLKVDAVKKLWLEAVKASTPSDKKCPCCVNMLKEFIVSKDNQRLHIDLCKACQLMWFDRNELEAFPRVEKMSGLVMDENLAIAKIKLDAELESEQSSVEKIIAQVMDILFLIIRLFYSG